MVRSRYINQCIELSNGKGIPASQAFTQRALIYKYNENNQSALEDFQAAAKLGSKFAQAEATKLNPYAALCNAMLKRMMGELNGTCLDSKTG